ncbi:MAG: Fic family protein [Hyphomicrobiaceae bacterium]
MFNPAKPHNELPLLPPKVDLETKAVLRKCVGARTALAELKIAGQLIPDQTVLSSIPLLEAKVSSEIENIVTTHDAIFREASLPDNRGDPSAKEAVRYRAALYDAFRALAKRPISTRLAIEICQKVKGVELDIRTTPGTTLRNSQTGTIIYTPPEAHLLPNLLANWESFINGPSDLDPVLRMAVQHYQFEAIHPFIDGNGRTGRILNVLVLIQDGLLELPILYLSRYILAKRSEYYRLLGEVTTRGDWIPWLLYTLDGVEATARWTTQKIRAIRTLMDATSDHLRERAPKIHSRELVELIFAQPYCRIADVVERGIAKRQAASKYLQTLREIGILLELPRLGDREKVFVNVRYRELLGAEHNVFEPLGT